MTIDEATRRIDALSVAQRQSRYAELAQKVAQVVLLTEAEMLELVLLRDSLQRLAADRVTESRNTK